MKTNNKNLIPESATITLPAADYYALVKLANDLIAERDKQLQAIQVTIENGHVSICYHEQVAYAQDVKARVAELLSTNEEAMEILVEHDEYRFTPGERWLTSYSWSGSDLREEFTEFDKAWQAAVIRRNNEMTEELKGGSDNE
jgi:hypothetical protein